MDVLDSHNDKNQTGYQVYTDFDTIRLHDNYIKNREYHHDCNHVKYDNYETHLANHHQVHYTFGKKRRKIQTHRLFDHRYHHEHHVKMKEPKTPTPLVTLNPSFTPPQTPKPFIPESKVEKKKSWCSIL